MYFGTPDNADMEDRNNGESVCLKLIPSCKYLFQSIPGKNETIIKYVKGSFYNITNDIMKPLSMKQLMDKIIFPMPNPFSQNFQLLQGIQKSIITLHILRELLISYVVVSPSN